MFAICQLTTVIPKRIWLSQFGIYEDDLHRIERLHPERQEKAIQKAGGNRDRIREYLLLQPDRRPQHLRSLRESVIQPKYRTAA